MVIRFDTAADAFAKLVVANPRRLADATVVPGGTGDILAVDPTGTDLLLIPRNTPYDGDVLEVRRVHDPRSAYRLAGIEERGSAGIRPPDLFLTDQIVEANYFGLSGPEFHPEVRAWNRADGSAAESQVLSGAAVGQAGEDAPFCKVSGPRVVPGATLVFCSWRDRVELIGFNPH
ncbi:hypothetical protein LTV02_35100 [Nocardia yamanashiensis]|uniref:hypothetical protein n=1 Tax=Nocardia yamanashiensis TaxID=209247 RepID=UPI001E3083E8|nr:hypothetical protein [Nocardia yamanashiensis]UGT41124.1 hypothetical protein LTV02_35100 [Nocardia yamanashiensis]